VPSISEKIQSPYLAYLHKGKKLGKPLYIGKFGLFREILKWEKNSRNSQEGRRPRLPAQNNISFIFHSVLTALALLGQSFALFQKESGIKIFYPLNFLKYSHPICRK